MPQLRACEPLDVTAVPIERLDSENVPGDFQTFQFGDAQFVFCPTRRDSTRIKFRAIAILLLERVHKRGKSESHTYDLRKEHTPLERTVANQFLK